MCIEMRRAVKIRERLRVKRVGYDIVDAPHKQMIRDPFHRLKAFIPSVRAKRLAHGSPLLLRVEMCRGCPEFRKRVVVELTVASACVKCIVMVVHAGHHLSADHIDSGEIHSLLTAEKVSCPVSQTCMCSVVLDGMSEVIHSTGAAPVADHICKILIVQPCNRIHVFQPDLRLFAVSIHPEERQIFRLKAKLVFKPFPPWENHVGSDSSFRSLYISEPWFIGKESLNRCAELILIMSVVRLVHFIDQHLSRFFHKRVQIILRGFLTALSCLIDNEDTVRSRRNIQRQNPFLHIHPVSDIRKSLRQNRVTGIISLISPLRQIHAEDLLTAVRLIPWPAFEKLEINAGAANRSLYIKPSHVQIFFQILRIALLYFPICKTGREMGIIKNPQFHPKLMGFLYNQIHVRPPSVSNEIRMRTRLDADSLHPAARDLVHIFRKHGMLFPVLPEKGIKYVLHFFPRNILKSSHTSYPPYTAQGRHPSPPYTALLQPFVFILLFSYPLCPQR